jgi:CRISPR-associated protein Csm5
MRYRLTSLTPLLVGDGRRLSPIDYMVWKDQVNVLDQQRIFRLLAKGPRLDGYLTQLKKADKLDFASWGGFAQNFADRRVPFEHSSMMAYWEKARAESLFIPTFCSGTEGPYLPGSAIKGALRTGMLFARWEPGGPARLPQGERMFGRFGEAAEDQALGGGGTSVMRAVAVADSTAVTTSALKLYLLRVSTLVSRGPARYELGWKQAPRGSSPGDKPGESTPIFAEMAAPGTMFEGMWRENAFVARPEVARALRWREPVTGEKILAAANQYAARLLAIQKQYAVWAGLPLLQQSVERLEARLAEAQATPNSCLLALGWGSGLLAKTGWLDTESENYRRVLQQVPLYNRALATGLPFPKTRRIVFLNNQPATLPGWAVLEVG